MGDENPPRKRKGEHGKKQLEHHTKAAKANGKTETLKGLKSPKKKKKKKKAVKIKFLSQWSGKKGMRSEQVGQTPGGRATREEWP